MAITSRFCGANIMTHFTALYFSINSSLFGQSCWTSLKPFKMEWKPEPMPSAWAAISLETPRITQLEEYSMKSVIATLQIHVHNFKIFYKYMEQCLIYLYNFSIHIQFHKIKDFETDIMGQDSATSVGFYSWFGERTLKLLSSGLSVSM